MKKRAAERPERLTVPCLLGGRTNVHSLSVHIHLMTSDHIVVTYAPKPQDPGDFVGPGRPDHRGSPQPGAVWVLISVSFGHDGASRPPNRRNAVSATEMAVGRRQERHLRGFTGEYGRPSC